MQPVRKQVNRPTGRAGQLPPSGGMQHNADQSRATYGVVSVEGAVTCCGAYNRDSCLCLRGR
jgi:hypothetical protein